MRKSKKTGKSLHSLNTKYTHKQAHHGMFIHSSYKPSYADALIVPRFSSIRSRSEVNIESHLEGTWLTLKTPLFIAAMDLISNPRMERFAIEHGFMCATSRGFHEEFAAGQDLTGRCISVGVVEHEAERQKIDALLQCKGQFIISIDIAHGDSQQMIDSIHYLKKARKKMGLEFLIMGGNVCTPEGAQHLRDAGADLVKVGIGPSPFCATRAATGCGYPQLSAVLECCAIDPKRRFIVADGGIKNAGDVAKAMAAGAFAVMCGSFFAGTDLTFDHPEEKEQTFYGMASALGKKTMGIVPRYIEGRVATIPNKGEGSTLAAYHSVVDGLKSAMSYCGCNNLHDFHVRKGVEFVFQSSGSIKESQF